VAATNQNEVVHAVSFIGRSDDEMRSDEMKSDEMSDMNAP